MIDRLLAHGEAAAVLCDCGPDQAGRVHVSLELLAELGLDIRTVDGTAILTA